MVKSEKSHAGLDELTRRNKANKIISILGIFVDLNNCDVLDIGTGSGHIIQDISKKCKSATSVDLRDERIVSSGYQFKRVIDEQLPFANETFDVVLSNHVIEHVLDQKLHLSEIYRVLKKDGLLYLATPNKYWIIDPHYELPLISWFPRKISSFYLKVIKNKSWDIYPLSYKNIIQLTKSSFLINNLTIDIMKNPNKYYLDVFKPIQPIVSIVPVFILKLFNPFAPTYILVLRKK